MAILVNGQKVAGVGMPGKSAYKQAVEGGFTGTEDEFSAYLADPTTKTYVDEHADDTVYSDAGAHGFRYNGTDETLEVYNTTSGAWEPVASAGGGIAPLDVQNIATVLKNGRVDFTWTDPEDTEVSGSIICKWAGTKLVRKAGSYPTSVKDGVLVVDSKKRNAYKATPFTDSGLTNGTTYYYQFFPYSDQNCVNTNETNRTTAVPNRVKIDGVPAQTGSLTYSGVEQTPVWENYNKEQLVMGGTTTATNAGSFTATFTPTADYCWSDGTAGVVEAVWTINKAAGSVTLNPTSVTLNSSTLTKDVTVTRLGDGAISATSSNTSVSTVSVDGTTVTVSHVNQTTGSATVTVTVAESANYLAASKTLAVNAEFISSTLNNNSWATIHSVSSTGSNYWSVGDRKAVTVNGTVGTLSVNATYYVFILGFNHNSSREGNGITFGCFKTSLSGGTDICLVDSLYGSYSTGGTKYFNMNHSSNTSSGGWKSCNLRYDVLGSTNSSGGNAGTSTATSPVSNTLMAALPSDLRAVMQPMTIYSDNTGGGGANVQSYITSTIDYLPLLAEYEIQGARSYANSYESSYQAQYAYYSAGNSKVKYQHSSTSSTAYWWTRSADSTDSSYFCIVYTVGSANTSYARSSRGLAGAFRV